MGDMLNKLVYSVFLLALTSQILEVKGAPSAALIERCCNLGRNWFTESRESCNRYQTTTILGVETEDQEMCRNILDLCCVQEKTDKQCVKGKQIAKIRGTCSELQSQSGNEHAKECCNCCRLGRMFHDMGMSCDAPWVGETFGARCVGMFQECCNVEEIDEPEPEEPGIVEPTEQPRPQLPDDEPDICARFPGQLCGHICIPLPGSSFKCSCHIGFELQADQKTCRQQNRGNRCDLNNPCQHQCIDTGVAIHCDCFDGYLLQSDGRSCADLNECLDGSHNCKESDTCRNTQGSFECIKRQSNTYGNALEHEPKAEPEPTLPPGAVPLHIPEDGHGHFSSERFLSKDDLDLSPDGIPLAQPSENYRNDPSERYTYKKEGDPSTSTGDLPIPVPNERNGLHTRNNKDSLPTLPPGAVPLHTPITNDRGVPLVYRQGQTGAFNSNRYTGNGVPLEQPRQEGREIPVGPGNVPFESNRDYSRYEYDRNRAPLTDNDDLGIDPRLLGEGRIPFEPDDRDQYPYPQGTYGGYPYENQHNGLPVDPNILGVGRVPFEPDPRYIQNGGVPYGPDYNQGSVGQGQRHRGFPLELENGGGYDRNGRGQANRRGYYQGGEYFIENDNGDNYEQGQEFSPGPSVGQGYNNGGDYHLQTLDNQIPHQSKEFPPDSQFDTDNYHHKIDDKDDEQITDDLPEPEDDKDSDDAYSNSRGQTDQAQIHNNVNGLPSSQTDYDGPSQPQTDSDKPFRSFKIGAALVPLDNDDSEINNEDKTPGLIFGHGTPSNHQNTPQESQTLKQRKDIPLVKPRPGFHHTQLMPSCAVGYEYDPQIQRCSDVDECLFNRHNCLEGQVCLNTQGAFVCKEGDFGTRPFGDGDSVEDNGNAGNQDEPIVPTPVCQFGYQYNSDSGRCEDVDECAENTHTCNIQQTCVNNRGSFICEDNDNPNDGGGVGGGGVDGVNQPNTGAGCELGFAYNRIHDRCEDIDECIIGRDTCTREEQCYNTEGSYRCQRISNPGYVDCGEGYKYNPATLRCELDFRPNTGNTRVDCGAGFTYNQNTQRCEDLDECATGVHNCHGMYQICRNTMGRFNCQCQDGFGYNVHTMQCEDINECALNRDTCLEGQTCENNVGSYKCRRTISCGTGYTVDTNSQSCVDDDECVLGTHNCGIARECRNVPGSFRCVNKECPQGYRLDYTTGQCTVVICPKGLKADAIGNCIDINECQERSNPCRANQECRNTIGSFSCRNKLTCRAGHNLNEAGTQCLDIDECADNALNDCRGLHQFCTNRPGTYLCQCEEGFRMDIASRQCEDINECDQYGGQVCALNAKCENTEGSFMCICKEGFRSEENGRVCRDIDECENTGMCMHNCRNTWGSFQCTCFDGYQLAEDKRSCEDIDECSLWSRGGGQLCIGHCQNTPGSYQCSCPTGYVMMNDGRTCQDVDECATKTANCDGADNICINTRGGFKCESVTCPKGFVKAPSLGNRNNNIRCQRQTFVCPQGDTECLYAPLSYSINYITFPSQIQVPADLFTMRGPLTPHRRLQFVLTMNAARDPRTGEKRVTSDFFKLNNVRSNEAVVQLLRRIEGPQDVELQLNMNIYSTEFSDNAEEIFFGTAVAKITLFVTGDEWNNARKRTHFLFRKYGSGRHSISYFEYRRRQNRQPLGSPILGQPPPLYSGDIEKDGIVCLRLKCNSNDIPCLLNNTKSIQYHHISLPSLPELKEPIVLIKVKTIGYSVYPNVLFTLVEPTSPGIFDVKKVESEGNEADLRLLRGIQGPQTITVKMKMDNRNRYDNIISSHYALIKFYISEFGF